MLLNNKMDDYDISGGWELDSDNESNFDYLDIDSEYEISNRQKKKLIKIKRKEIEKLDVFEKTQDFLFCIEKELMENTWHPSRYMFWCLDIEEQKELGII